MTPRVVRPPARIDDSTRTAVAWLLTTAALACLSYLLARGVGLGPSSGPWAFWPINGLLVGIFYRRPRREWPWLALVAALTQSLTILLVRGDLAGGATPVAALAGVTQSLLGAWVLLRWGTPGSPLGSTRDLALFVGLTAVLVPLLVTPLTGVVLASGLSMALFSTWQPLFVGNSLSVLLFAPLLLPDGADGERGKAHALEIFCCELLTLAGAAFIFSGSQRWVDFVILPYAAFPLLVWSAARFGSRWTGASIFIVSLVSAWCTARGMGPFAYPGEETTVRVIHLQGYLASLAFAALLLSALTEQRRRAYWQLALQLAIQEAFFESSAALIVLKDLEGRYVLLNGATERVYQRSRQELLGRAMDEVLTPDTAAMIRAHDQRVLERGEPLRFEEPMQVDGVARTLLTTRFPVRDHRGVVRYLGMIARDDTLERELARRLGQMQKVELLGQLGAGVAHDLNNLLVVVSGNAEWLLEQADRHRPGEDTAILRDMHAAAGRAALLTGRLLALGRGHLAAREPVDVDALLRSLQPLLKALAGGSVDLALRLAAGPARVAADALELEQVVLNLVSNARAAIRDLGEIVISTSLVAVEQVPTRQVGSSRLPEDRTPSRWLRLSVRDSGSGMDAVTLQHLFEAFFTTRAEASGTGLGLYSSAVLVRQTGGVIYAESVPGEGSTFTVDLPCLPDESS